MIPKHVFRLALMAAAASAHAAVPTSQISADAKWVMHIDMDRFAKSGSYASLAKDPEHGRAFQSYLARYRLLLGVEPLKDIRHVTLYGEDISGSRGVALVAGDLNPDLFARRLSGNPKYQTKMAGKRTIHQWLDRTSGTTLAACFHTSRLLAIASDEAALTAALYVLGGNKKSLADAREGLPVPAPRNGAFFVAATRGYAGSAEGPLRAAILRNTDTASLSIGDDREMVDAVLRLDAVSPEAAMQIEAIWKGLVLLAGAADDDNGLGKLAELSRIVREDKTIHVTLKGKACDAAGALMSSVLGSPPAAPEQTHRPKEPAAGR